MLTEFSVRNFKSIGEKVTFSMVASNSAKKRENGTHATGNAMVGHVLASSILLGANASGKSSFIESLKFMQDFILNSANESTQGQIIKGLIQNKLSMPERQLEEPLSEFEIIFSHNGYLYIYGFKLSLFHINKEWLLSRKSAPRSKTHEIFSRTYNTNKKKYDWEFNKAALHGNKESWRNATRDNALFLSTAVQMNSETLAKPFDWFVNGLTIITDDFQIDAEYISRLLENEAYKENILDFIKALDFRIKDFRIVQKSTTDYEIFVQHLDKNGELTEFKISEESAGTQSVVALAGHFLCAIEDGKMLVVDELNNSLHPVALLELMRVFQEDHKNKNGAQLLFSSHETSVTLGDFLHKDQIWLVERVDGIQTTLTQLSDFDIANTKKFQTMYLAGRFGAIPDTREYLFR